MNGLSETSRQAERQQMPCNFFRRGREFEGPKRSAGVDQSVTQPVQKPVKNAHTATCPRVLSSLRAEASCEHIFLRRASMQKSFDSVLQGVSFGKVLLIGQTAASPRLWGGGRERRG